MGLTVSPTSIGLTANAALLDDPATVFPVVLDPTGSPAIYNWTMVNHSYPTTSYSNFTSADEGVGYNNYAGVHIKRIYYSFPTSGYNGKTIISATLSAFETYSATCAPGTVNAYLTGDVSSSTTWNTQPGKITGVLSGWSTKAGRSDCYPGGKTASWNVKSGVANRVAANASRSTFALQGSTESSSASWMRFGGPKNSTTTKRPTLSVTYNSTPATVALSNMWVPTTSKACTASASTGPVLNPTVGAAESMYAKITDADGGNLTSELELLKADNTRVSLTSFSSRASGSTIGLTVPPTLTDGVYKFRVRAKDAYVWGGWSASCHFTVDTTKPTLTLTSPTWAEGVLAPADATAGPFVMTAPGASTVSYRWNSEPTAQSGTPNSSGQVTKATTMARTLDYWQATASDAAGNTSGTETYYVKRAQPAKLAEYLFDSGAPLADTGTSQLNSSAPLSDPDAAAAYAFDIDPSFGAFTQPGRFDLPNGQAAGFDGSGSAATVPSRPVVSERSFTVGGWVLMGDREQSRTVVSQLLDADPADPATPRLAFDLGYDVTLDRFVARIMDPAGTVRTQAVDALPGHIAGDPGNAELTRDGSWVYLVMVYDATAGTLRLDANHSGNADPPDSDFSTLYRGETVAGVGQVASSRGEFLIGAGSSAQGDRAGWFGLVDNLAIWQGVPADATILLNANTHQ
jgi:hypothetical protein